MQHRNCWIPINTVKELAFVTLFTGVRDLLRWNILHPEDLGNENIGCERSIHDIYSGSCHNMVQIPTFEEMQFQESSLLNKDISYHNRNCEVWFLFEEMMWICAPGKGMNRIFLLCLAQLCTYPPLHVKAHKNLFHATSHCLTVKPIYAYRTSGKQKQSLN